MFSPVYNPSCQCLKRVEIDCMKKLVISLWQAGSRSARLGPFTYNNPHCSLLTAHIASHLIASPSCCHILTNLHASTTHFYAKSSKHVSRHRGGVPPHPSSSLKKVEERRKEGRKGGKTEGRTLISGNYSWQNCLKLHITCFINSKNFWRKLPGPPFAPLRTLTHPFAPFRSLSPPCVPLCPLRPLHSNCLDPPMPK